MGYCINLPNGAAIFGQWLFEWQTLIGGILALVAAFGAIYYTRRQIRQAADFERAKLTRQHNAEKALLGLTLSQITQSCICAVQHYSAIERDGLDDQTFMRQPPRCDEVLVLPNSVAERLYGFLASTDDERLIRLVSEICQKIQVRQAREQGERSGRSSDRIRAVVDLSAIYAMSESLFDYVRGEGAPPSYVAWETAAKILVRVRVYSGRWLEAEAEFESLSLTEKNCWAYP
jgi:hypothetical protein